jgi:hypothetical protein
MNAPALQYTARLQVSLTDGIAIGIIQTVLLYGDISKAINEPPKLLKSASGTPKSPCSEICHSASEIRQMASEIMLTHNEIFANAKVIRNNISVGRGFISRRFFCHSKA